MRGSLRGRLARALGVTAALSVAATAVVAYGLVRRAAEQDARDQLNRHADAVARESAALDAGVPATLRRVLRASGDAIAVIGPRGRIGGDDPDATEVANAIDLGALLAGRRLNGKVRTTSGSFVYVAVPISGQRGGNAGVVLSRPVGLVADVWRPILVRLAVAGAAAVAVAVAVSYWLARRMTEPLKRLSDATARLAKGDLSHRVAVEGTDEIAGVAARFNEMADSLAEARRREHEFLASVSHELRTPITAIRGYAEAIGENAVTGETLNDAVAVIHDEAGRLERLVQDVLDLARLGAKEFRLEPARVDLAATIEEAVRAHQAKAAEGGATLVADADSPLPLTTDAGRVRQIISNLIENALRVTPDGGSVRVAGRTRGSVVVVEVSDTGPGIAAEDLPHVFERSYLWGRSKAVRQVGTGLGLAIVRELATALGGSLGVESEPGRGSTFRLSLSDIS